MLRSICAPRTTESLAAGRRFRYGSPSTEMGNMRLGAVVLVVCAAARAEEPKAPGNEPKTAGTFEQALEGAEPIGDLTDRFDPLFADCKRDDDLEARQCAAVRDQMLERLKTGTFVGNGDEASLTWTPWTPGEKQLGLE